MVINALNSESETSGGKRNYEKRKKNYVSRSKQNIFSLIHLKIMQFTLIISKYVHRNSLPGQRSVAMTAFGEWVWITAPAPRCRYGNMNNGVHWLFFNLQFCAHNKTNKMLKAIKFKRSLNIRFIFTFCIRVAQEYHHRPYFGWTYLQA